MDLMHLQCNIFTKKTNAGCFRLHPLLTFLACAVFFPSPHDADVREKRLLDQPKECLCVMQGAFYASLLSLSLSFIFLKLFLYTQSVVCILYYTESMYYTQSVVSGPHFLPSQSFIPSPQSVIRSPQSVFYTDRFKGHLHKQTEQRMGRFHCNLYQTKWMLKRFILGVKPCETHE